MSIIVLLKKTGENNNDFNIEVQKAIVAVSQYAFYGIYTICPTEWVVLGAWNLSTCAVLSETSHWYLF